MSDPQATCAVCHFRLAAHIHRQPCDPERSAEDQAEVDRLRAENAALARDLANARAGRDAFLRQVEDLHAKIEDWTQYRAGVMAALKGKAESDFTGNPAADAVTALREQRDAYLDLCIQVEQWLRLKRERPSTVFDPQDEAERRLRREVRKVFTPWLKRFRALKGKR